jgi:hypothetical protein
MNLRLFLLTYFPLFDAVVVVVDVNESLTCTHTHTHI